MKYFLYARKSTEDEERQVMSIEAQIFELEQYAQRENISISERFIESKSAKKPGREIFNQMMAKIYESSEPVGLLSWHPDRLARNSVDGGQIIYCIDTQKIVSLRFPCFWFEPTPQGLFMLQVAFGQSKYYSDSLSENVKRGIRNKLRRGEWLSKAPLGYINNLKTRNIELDPIKHKIIKKIFTEFAEGKFTLHGISERLSFLGETAKGGKLHCKSMIQKLLTNKVYIGLIDYNGEIFSGSFPPIIDKRTFDKVQEVMKLRARPRKSKVTHNFPFTGLFHCSECKAMITAQFGHGNGGEYRYYRCTKRLGSCSQKYIQEKELVEQLKSKIMSVSISEGWINKMLDKIKEWEKSAKGSQKAFAQNLQNKIKETDQKLEKLVGEFLEGNIEKEIYIKMKNELVQKKKILADQLVGFGRNKNASFGWIEPLRDWVISLSRPEQLQNTDDFLQIKSFVQKIGSNHSLHNKKALFDLQEPYNIVQKYQMQTREPSRNGGGSASRSNYKNDSQFTESRDWWAVEDSNL